MIKEIKTLKEAAQEWVTEFDAIDIDIIDSLMLNVDEIWEEVTLPVVGDEVWIFGSEEKEGEIVGYDDGQEEYVVEVNDGKTIKVDKDYLELKHRCDSYGSGLPMWGTMWSFHDPCDIHWIEEGEGIAALSECGFRIYHSDRFGYFFGIDGAGYDFYEAHWIPLYLKRGLKWHEKTRWFAEIKWCADDIIYAAEQQGIELTEEQAEKWWEKNQYTFSNKLIEDGNEILSHMSFDLEEGC